MSILKNYTHTYITLLTHRFCFGFFLFTSPISYNQDFNSSGCMRKPCLMTEPRGPVSSPNEYTLLVLMGTNLPASFLGQSSLPPSLQHATLLPFLYSHFTSIQDFDMIVTLFVPRAYSYGD